MELIIPPDEILTSMEKIDACVNVCLMAVHGVRYILSIQEIVNDDIKLQAVLDHYFSKIIAIATQMSDEVNSIVPPVVKE